MVDHRSDPVGHNNHEASGSSDAARQLGHGVQAGSHVAVELHSSEAQAADRAVTDGEPTLAVTPNRTYSYAAALRGFLSVKKTSSASARDFLARERNFFLWIRLSTLLAVLSASLLLQLRLPDSAPDSSDDSHRNTPRKRRPNELPPDELPLASKIFAIIFFLMSLVALATGSIDYLLAERQLETEKVDFEETEGAFHNDGHTTSAVHYIMILIGLGIVASALWLITT